MIYAVVIHALPEKWRDITATILIFSDPGAMGLFFMGAIILLEKSQRTLCSMAVSPVSEGEYIWSKVFSLGIISTGVAVLLAITSGKAHIFLLILGSIITSVIFSLLGMIVATKIDSLNQFILGTVPVEILGFGPAILYVFQIDFPFFKFFPPNICIAMVAGAAPTLLEIGILVLFIIILYFMARRNVRKMWRRLGGAKL